MSTILNTLKKLEEEKSVLEKNVNLKGLLLQGQESSYPQFARQTQRKWGQLGSVILGGLLFAGLALYFFSFSESKLNRVEISRLPERASLVPELKSPRENMATSPGIPLSGIPDTKTVVEDDLALEEDFFGPEDVISPMMEAPPTTIAKQPITATKQPVIIATQPITIAEQPEPEGSAEIREIKNLIQAATTPKKMVKHSFEDQVFALSGPQHIPGLKLKGVIFFSPGNPANSIFIATPTEKNSKLKVGNTVLDATLESIEAQRAIFSYHGKMVEARIGG